MRACFTARSAPWSSQLSPLLFMSLRPWTWPVSATTKVTTGAAPFPVAHRFGGGQRPDDLALPLIGFALVRRARPERFYIAGLPRRMLCFALRLGLVDGLFQLETELLRHPLAM